MTKSTIFSLPPARACAHHSGMQPAPRISAPTRQVTCDRCGAVFGCGLGGDCWCATEPYRLPLSDAAAEDCLCPDCLRALAATPR